MNIGERIAFYRRQKGLRQEDLARQVGVSAQAVQELLAQPPEEQIEKLCEIFWMLQKSLIETKEVQWLFNSLGFIPDAVRSYFPRFRNASRHGHSISFIFPYQRAKSRGARAALKS